MRYLVSVGLKPEVLDVEGRAILDTLKRMGFAAVQDVRVKKSFEIELDPAAVQGSTGDDPSQRADAIVRKACDDLLSNPTYQAYSVSRLERP